MCFFSIGLDRKVSHLTLCGWRDRLSLRMLIRSDARHIPLKDESVQCVVTSPPYWRLRKYSGDQEQVWGGLYDCGHVFSNERYYTEQTAAGSSSEAFSVADSDNAKRLKEGRWRDNQTCVMCGAWRGSYGLEPTIDAYVEHTVEIFREVRRVLRKDGVCFLNIGDSYNAAGRSGHGTRVGYKQQTNRASADGSDNYRPNAVDLKPKDLCLIPFRVALALQADGWWVRSDIIWNKPNPMPESVRDRPTDAYEHIFMLTKSARYYWDAEAVAEPQSAGSIARRGRNRFTPYEPPGQPVNSGLDRPVASGATRNLRNVWTFPTQPYKGAHFATFPEELVTRCVRAATKPLDIALDPFAGSGTVGKVALKMGRRLVLCDLAYQDLQCVRVVAPIIT